MPATITVDRARLNAAAGSNLAMQQAFASLADAVDGIYQNIGNGPVKKVDSTSPKSLGVPAQCGFTVTGANGSFAYQITLPQQAGGSSKPQNVTNATIYQEISSSTSADFSSGVTTYPVTTATSGSFSLPGDTLYWRLRSSYDQVSWNTYSRVPGSVAAGLQSSAATEPNVNLNQSNFARIDSIGAGGSATIRIYGSGGVGTAWTSITGTNSKVIPGGTIANITYGTTQYVAWDGAQYRVVPSLTQAFPDGWLPVGSTSVISNGAGLTLPTVDPVVQAGAIIAYNVTNGGNDITGPLTFTLATPGGGVGATVGPAVVTNGVLQSVAPGNPGSGYSAGTTVVVTGGISSGIDGGGGARGSNGGRLYGLTSNGV